jgi:thioesterase domain-containing protein/acyl carrier protein
MKHIMSELTTQNLKDKLSSIWRKILAVESVHHDDNFFSVGGHSILAIEFITEIENNFKIQLNMKDIVESPSLGELTLLLNQRLQTENLIKLQDEVRIHHDSYPLSLNQKQVWSLNALYPDSTTHNISTAIRIKTPLDADLLSQTFNYIIQRQDALRTNFKVINNTPVQVIVERAPLQISFIDIQESEINQVLHKEMNYCFNLETDELLRVRFFRLGPSEYIFFFLVHHIIWDGMSNTMFFHEFNHCYHAFKNNLDPALPPIRMTLKEHALAEAQNMETEQFKEEKAEWMKMLSGKLPELNLKTDFPRTQYISPELDTVYFEIKGEQLTRLEAYAQTKHLSIYNVMMAVYNVVLAKTTGQLDLIVGTPVHGRNGRDIRKTFGYFINTLPIRSYLNPEKSFRENLGIVMESLKNAFYNQSVPLDVLIKMLNNQSEHKQSALFQTLFIYLDVTKELDVFEELNFEQIKINRLSGHTEIDFYLYKSRHKIDGVIEFKKDLFNQTTIHQLAETFQQVLNQILTSEEITLRELGVNTTAVIKAPATVKKAKTKKTSQQQSPTSLELTNIWKDIIGLKDIDPNENFFNLGGHSIQAVEIFTIINERFELDLPISAIFEAGSVNALAVIIDEELAKIKPMPALKSVVTIKSACASKGKIFCFHGAGGNVLNYYSLGKYVGDKAFYGVQSLGVNGDSFTVNSIQEMADMYIQEILLVQPQGPYILAGGSMGGMIALEVARQLQLKGKVVQEIVMFDTFGPYLDEAKYGRMEIPLSSRIVSRFLNLKESMLFKGSLLITRLLKKNPPQHLRYQLLQKKNLSALYHYRPAPYAGNLTLFRALSEPRGWYADPYLGWRNTILGEIRVIEVDGSHENFMESQCLAHSFQTVIAQL